MRSVCVECGKTSEQQLYREFSGGTVQLSQCPHCESVIDKYVEFDAVILLLDVLLLRVQSYRHLIFNYGISNSVLWKCSVVLVLCEAYTQLRMLRLDTPDSVKVQIHFHTLLLQAIIEFLFLVLCGYLLVVATNHGKVFSFTDVCRSLVISSCGRLCALGAMVWTGDFYLWVPWLLVLPTQVQAFRALLGISVREATVITAVLMASLVCVGVALTKARLDLLLYLQIV